MFSRSLAATQRILTAAAFVFAAISVSHAAQAAGEDVILQTSDVEVDHNYGASEGNLHLTVGNGGEIVGYFRAVDQGRLVDVHGAVAGSKMYLYIGDREIEGTYTDGKFDAYTLEGDRVHHFIGVAASTDRL